MPFSARPIIPVGHHVSINPIIPVGTCVPNYPQLETDHLCRDMNLHLCNFSAVKLRRCLSRSMHRNATLPLMGSWEDYNTQTIIHFCRDACGLLQSWVSVNCSNYPGSTPNNKDFVKLRNMPNTSRINVLQVIEITQFFLSSLFPAAKLLK